MSPGPARWVAAFLSALLVLSPSVALAEHGEERAEESSALTEAKASFERASRAYEGGRYHEALVGFQAAYRRAPLPAFLFNIGQCQRHLNKPREALASYTRYLETSPAPPPNEALTRDLMSELEARLAWQKRTEQELRAKIEKELLMKFASEQHLRDSNGLTAEPLHRRWYFWTGMGVFLVASGVAMVAVSAPAQP